MLYFRVLFIVICFSCILWLGYMTMLLLALFVYCQKVAFYVFTEHSKVKYQIIYNIYGIH